MPNFTITAPASIIIRGVEGTSTITVNAPAVVPPITPPVIPPITPPTPPTPSPAWTEMPPAAQLVMANHSIVTIKAGAAQLNGAPMGHSTFVAKMLVDAKGAIWQNSTDPAIAGGSGWWPWTGAAWGAQAADPRPGAVVPPVVPPVIIPPIIIPPVAGSTPRTRLIAYLQSISGSRCLIGQTSFPDEREFDEMTAQAVTPALMINDPWVVQFAGVITFDGSFMARQLAHARDGGVVGISLMLPNPLTGQTSQTGGIDLGRAIQSGTAENAGLNRMLDQAIPLFNQHKSAGNAVLTRFMFELDGGWFWWGSNSSPASQTALYHYIVTYLRNAGLGDTCLTTFAVNGGPGTYQYPGDDWVDVVGMDAYTDNLAGVYAGVYNTLRSQAPSKLIALTEDGSGGPGSPDRSFNEAQVKIDIQSALPRICYVNFWSGWQPDTGQGAKAAMSDPFWINKSQVKLT